MPVAPSILKAIRAVSRELGDAPKSDHDADRLFAAVNQLFHKPDRIIGDPETLDAVLALRPELDAYRGKGKQLASRWFDQGVTSLIYHLKVLWWAEDEGDEGAIDSGTAPITVETATLGLEKLADFAFERVQGPRVRSREAARRRLMAWEMLGSITRILRRTEHLEHALRVASDPRASVEERMAAVDFLPEYWGEDEPDEATLAMLRKVEENPKDRDLLVSVQQAQIDFGLRDEFEALMAVEDWDEEQEE